MKPTTMTRAEAAAALGCSVRTVDRRIPPGTPGRTGGGYGRTGLRAPVAIEHRLVEALMPLPIGDDDAN